jgi:hypothetical protein
VGGRGAGRRAPRPAAPHATLRTAARACWPAGRPSWTWLTLGRSISGLASDQSAILQRAALASPAGQRGSAGGEGIAKRLGPDKISVGRGQSGGLSDAVVCWASSPPNTLVGRHSAQATPARTPSRRPSCNQRIEIRGRAGNRHLDQRCLKEIGHHASDGTLPCNTFRMLYSGHRVSVRHGLRADLSAMRSPRSSLSSWTCHASPLRTKIQRRCSLVAVSVATTGKP